MPLYKYYLKIAAIATPEPKKGSPQVPGYQPTVSRLSMYLRILIWKFLRVDNAVEFFSGFPQETRKNSTLFATPEFPFDTSEDRTYGTIL